MSSINGIVERERRRVYTTRK